MRSVIVLPRAQRQLQRAVDWWFFNRDKAPGAVTDEFVEMRDRIAENPAIGKAIHGRRAGIRRVLMERVRYYLYYRVNSNGDVEVLSVWHASRRPPRL